MKKITLKALLAPTVPEENHLIPDNILKLFDSLQSADARALQERVRVVKGN